MDSQNGTRYAETLDLLLKLVSPISLSFQEGANKLIINLSKTFIPSQEQQDLLKKGLTFIPTFGLHVDQKTQLQHDLQKFHRNIKINSYYEGKKKSEIIPFTPKSDWTPRFNQLPPNIKKYIIANNYALKTLHFNLKDAPNLTPGEARALVQLRKNKDIVIKPADKGSVIVIQDRDQYIWEAKRQLTNKEHYCKLSTPIYLETIPMVENLVNRLRETKFINKKQSEYLLGQDNPRPRRFYLLPKIHKDPKAWSKPFEVPPGRPIVSDCGSETYRVAEYIEHFLHPVSIKHPSYIKDTYDFIKKIQNTPIPKQSLLFTIDIDSLYTNIDTEAGLKAVRECFSRYPDSRRPDEIVIQLLELSLTRNDFEFNSEYFLQIKGTAMGKKFAPSYANIYMAAWEETALSICPIQPVCYYRYLDDIWGVWNDTEENFRTFVKILNNHHFSIKVKFELDKEKVNFLDTITFKGSHFQETGILETKVFFKTTDTHALLHRKSFHPKHTFKGIVKSQLLRFSRICSREEDFWEATQILFRALRERGYSRSFLRRILKTFRKRTIPEDKDIIPFITTYSSTSREINTKIKRNFNTIVQNSGTLKKYKIISAFRRNKNLGDLLVHSRLKSQQERTKTTACPEYKYKKWVSNKITNEVFPISPNLNYNSKNCIYLIYCIKCQAHYVGETGNSIATRITQHRYNIRRAKETNTHIVQHFKRHGLKSMRVTGVQGNLAWTQRHRKIREKKWIQLLNARFPGGLNE